MDPVHTRRRWWAFACAAVIGMLGGASAWGAEVSARIEPTQINVDEAARLTITASGSASIPEPPAVPGLEFSPVGQSRRIESVNGVTTSTSSATYRVTARQPGTYVISSIARGVAPLMLRVGGAPTAGQAGAPGAPTAPTASAQGAPPGSRAAVDGAAFVRLKIAKHQLYVGESVPVDIEVGTRDGVVASLNGTPTLNGDAFTLDKLAPEPEHRSEETIDGKPYTVFTWHSALAAVKPGELSLTMQIPLTVRVQYDHPIKQFQDDSLTDIFDDPAFQGFFGGSTERDITVSSAPVGFAVHDLPAQGRPADFSGAVGDFTIGTELSETHVAAGDPVTLRMHVRGEGNFDRVNSPMLGGGGPWKTYQPTAQFKSADNTSYRGEKTFEQPIVATQPGEHTVPALAFSFFNPATGRYETAHGEALKVDVAAAPAGQPGPAVASAPPPAALPPDVRRPDHLPGGRTVDTLVPIFFEPRYLVVPSALLAALPLTWFWLRRRERRAVAGARAAGDAPPEPRRLAGELERATSSGNVGEFFAAAKLALQRILARRWQVPPETVTLAEVDARLGADSEVRRLFAVADEAIYCGRGFARAELDGWKHVVLSLLRQESP